MPIILKQKASLKFHPLSKDGKKLGIFFSGLAFGSELDDSLDATTTTTMTHWPTSNGQFVDGEDDIFDNDDELQGLLDADNEAPEEVQVRNLFPPTLLEKQEQEQLKYFLGLWPMAADQKQFGLVP